MTSQLYRTDCMDFTRAQVDALRKLAAGDEMTAKELGPEFLSHSHLKQLTSARRKPDNNEALFRITSWGRIVVDKLAKAMGEDAPIDEPAISLDLGSGESKSVPASSLAVDDLEEVKKAIDDQADETLAGSC